MSDDFVARRGRERRGVRDGDDRVARIARFLATTKPIDAIQELALQCTATGGEEPEVIARWPRGNVSPDLAHGINELIQDFADDKACTVTALLFWAHSDGRPWLSKSFRCFTSRDNEELVKPLDGTLQSMLSQTQRHNEVFAKQIAMMAAQQDERWEKAFGVLSATIERLSQQREHAELLAEAAKAEAEAAVELAEEAADQADDARAAAEAAGQQDQLGKVLELATKQLMSGGRS